MIPQKQLYRHRPEVGEIGDCHRTVLACLLNLNPLEVPHFGEMDWDIENKCFKEDGSFHRYVKDYLYTKGLTTIDILFDCTLENVLQHLGCINPNIYYILGGISNNSVNHSVIGCGGEIIWDPGIDNPGIIGPCKPDGYYWVTYLVPILMVRQSSQ